MKTTNWLKIKKIMLSEHFTSNGLLLKPNITLNTVKEHLDE